MPKNVIDMILGILVIVFEMQSHSNIIVEQSDCNIQLLSRIIIVKVGSHGTLRVMWSVEWYSVVQLTV